MPSAHEDFWKSPSFAFVGHSAVQRFPELSYKKSKKLGKKVFAIDPGADRIQGDRAYHGFDELPEKVESVVLEVPRAETAEWVEKAADAGVRNVWVHMLRDTPEALSIAQERGLNVLTGSCAVMYLDRGPSYHSVHKLIAKLTHRY
jgi:predicted CoA-binding protein